MNDASAVQKAALQKQSAGTVHTLVPSRLPYMNKRFASRHVCFYKSGDAQFSGLPVVINNRTFKTFEALLDSLSKRIPLPFGVRTITTPRGHTAVRALDQLHHGHSYICSDKRIVKPINLEQARRRPPPWYNARPVSSRHLRVRQNPHPRNTRRTEHAALLHSPKRLVVFRNGDPEIKHTLLLHKRSTHSFEALLDDISEIMRFPVRRLHTPDGKRVDGLPALILCSGVLVAAGPEPFRKGNYDVQKPFAPTWLPAKSVRRLNSVTRKKKSMTSSTKSRPFSPSSERYIVNQLHNSFAEGAYDNTCCVEMGTGHLLESVAETDTVTGMDGDTNEYICMPTDDDIEKSFRVNQDGSMTVEMKVRLTIKEEETVHWTTTLSRQNVTSQMKYGSESHSDKIAPNVDTDDRAIHRWPEDYSNVSTTECLKALHEEMMNGTEEESTRIKELLYSREESNNKQEHCLVSAPGKFNKLQAGMYKSAEILQLHDSGQKTVPHIFEQQTCQKSFLANTGYFAQEMPKCNAVFFASPDTSKNDIPLLGLQTSCKKYKPPEINNSKQRRHTPLSESFKMLAARMISTTDTSKKKNKVRVIVKKSHIVCIETRKNRENKIDILKTRKKIRAAMCNQAGVIKSVTKQYRTKSTRKLLKSKRTKIPKTFQMQIQSLNELPVKEHYTDDKHPDKCTLTRQEEHKTQKQVRKELKEYTSLPALDYSSSVINNYVELWLQKSEREQLSDQDEVLPFKPLHKLLITCETPGSKLGSTTALPPHIPLDRMSVRKPFHFSPKEDSAPKGSSLSQSNTLKGEIKSSSNTSVNRPLLLTSLIGNNREMALEENIDNSISQEHMQLTGYAVLDYSLATYKKDSEKLSKPEIIQVPLPLKKDKISDELLDNALRCTNYCVKPTLTRKPSSEKTLCTQHSIEQIPKNNTLSKASLFSNQDIEKTALSSNATFNKMPKSGPSGMLEGSIITQGLVGSCENDKHAYCRPHLEKEVLPAVKSYTVKMAVRPDMRHVLDDLCHSIHLLCEATQHKQRSCLQKTNSMPDFSSYLASTFGSSSQLFLAFLSVMTLRNGLENLNALHQGENSLRCSEALLMLQSLVEMAVQLKDADQLRANLNTLKKSASNQLLQSWNGFQHLSDTCMSSHFISECPEEETIQGLMEELGVPDRVREELAAFHTPRTESVRCNQVETSEELCQALHTGSSLSKNKIGSSVCVLEDINTYVKSVVEKAVSAHINTKFFTSQLLLGTETDIKVVSCEKEINSCPKDSNIFDNIFEEKQQRKVHKRKQKIYAKQETHMKEMKDNAVCKQSEVTQRTIVPIDDCVEENCIMESRNGKEKLTIPEKKTSSLKEVNHDEHVNFRHDQSSDKEENLQINPQIEPQAKCQNEELGSQAHTELDCKTERVKKAGQPKMQSSLLAVCVEHGTHNQTKKICSKKQQVVVEIPECNTVYKENIDDQNKCSPNEAVECERQTVQAKKKNGSVAKLINNLETCTQRPSTQPVKSVHRLVGHTEVSGPDNLHKVSSTGNLKDTTLEANSSSLAFCYDSQSNSVAQESERRIQANRVKSIRDMFLAKSQTRTHTGQRHLQSPISDLSNSQPESTDSGGNWSQDTSSGEDDASRLAIAKGFVRKTIERLYGRNNSSGESADNMISPSALKEKQKESPERTNVSSVDSYHEACIRETDLSYFSATNKSDIFNVPTDCNTPHEQVRCGDANSIEKEQRLFVENQIEESSLKLKEGQRNGNKPTVPVEPEKQSGREDFFYKNQPSTKHKKCPESPGSKFTYFNLPNASDSELEPEVESEVKMSETQAPKTMAERNSFLLAFIPPVLKKANNKVHPLTEGTAPTVVNQPVKKQSSQTEVIKQSAEPDALETLFVFCGQHCPIL